MSPPRRCYSRYFSTSPVHDRIPSESSVTSKPQLTICLAASLLLRPPRQYTATGRDLSNSATFAANSSPSMSMFTAPGICPSLNSAGVRVSIICTCSFPITSAKRVASTESKPLVASELLHPAIIVAANRIYKIVFIVLSFNGLTLRKDNTTLSVYQIS